MVRCLEVTLVVSCITGLLSLAAVITLIVLWSIVLTPFTDYALVIDAGSTHSKIFVYSWPADKSDGVGTTSRVTQVTACDVGGTRGPPITSVTVPTVDNVKTYFDSAMTDCIGVIPMSRRSRTMIFLGATAGLRLSNINNPTYTNNLLNATRAYFATLGLRFVVPEVQVRIISGIEEGTSGWITSNMLMRQLLENNQPMDTYGVLDMGGASTQITFISPEATEHKTSLFLFNTNYEVYSYSYLCYGQEQTRFIYQGKLIQEANGMTLVDDPCLQENYNETISYSRLNTTACARDRYQAPATFTENTNVTFRGLGNFSGCRTRILQQLNICSPRSNCSINGTYQPTLTDSSLQFLAMSAFYSVLNSFATIIPLQADSNGNYRLNTTDFTKLFAVIESICNQSWSTVNTTDLRFRPFLCFNSMYHWTLLRDGYGITDNILKRFQVVRTIDSNEIGWTLGYMIIQTNNLDPEYRPKRLLTQAEFIGLMVTFAFLLLLSSVVVIGIGFIYRRHRR